jgi:hypothetical protein
VERIGNSFGQALQGYKHLGAAVQYGCGCTPTRRSSGKYTFSRKAEAEGNYASGS